MEQASKYVDHPNAIQASTHATDVSGVLLLVPQLTPSYLKHPEARSFHRTVLSPPHNSRQIAHCTRTRKDPIHPCKLHGLHFLRRTFRTSEETSLIRTHLSIIHHSSLVSMKPQGERHRSWNSTSRRQPHQRHLDLHKTRRFNSVYPLMSLAHDHDRIQIRQMSTR